MVELSKRYPEISQFERVPGIGVIGAHVFSAYIHTPHRFATKRKLWSYCRLGILECSSGGKSLAHKRLNRSGLDALKAVSYRCWLTSQCTAEPNEVSLFFEASLRRTGNATRARPAQSAGGIVDNLEEKCRLQAATSLFAICSLRQLWPSHSAARRMPADSGSRVGSNTNLGPHGGISNYRIAARPLCPI